ncbi:MAG: cysteine desulfurase/selenocysteine lyase [Acidimicrobiales bacterium]
MTVTAIQPTIDIAKVRDDTAGCEGVLHFNNAGSSLPPRPVVDAMVDYLRTEEVMGGYEIAADRAADLHVVYDASARYLNCDPSEIASTSSAADGWWRAFSSVPLGSGDRVLVGHSEYQANAFGWLQARERGAVVDVVPNNPAGDFDVEAFERMLDERVKLVSLTMVAMTNGAIHPVAEVGRVLKASGSGAIYLLDACQAAGQLPLDVAELGCDFLNYTGRKFMRGPRGTGVLFARSDVHAKLGQTGFLDGRSAVWTSADSYEYVPDARRFEFGESGYGGKVGLGVATNYMLDLGMEAIAARVASLSSLLRYDLSAIPKVAVLDTGTNKCGIVTFDVDGMCARDVQAALSAQGINVSTPGVMLAQLELGPRSIDAVVRASVHYFNTEEEVARFCQAVAEL